MNTDSSGTAGKRSVPGLRALWGVLSSEFHPERRGIATSSLISTASACTEVGLVFTIAAVAARIVDQTEGGPVGLASAFTIRELAVAAVALLVARACLDLALVFVESRAVRHYELRARREIVDAFLGAEWAIQTSKNPGEVAGALMSYQGKAVSSFNTLLSVAAMAASFIVMVMGSFVAGGLSVLAILGATVMLAVGFRPLMKRTHRAGQAVRDATQRYSGVWWEATAATLETRLFRANHAMRDRIDTPLRDLVNANTDSTRAVGLLQTLYTSAVYGVAVIGLGVLAVTNYDQAASYAAVVLLLYRGLTYGKGVQATYQRLISDLPSIEALRAEREALKAASAPTSGHPLADPVSEIRFSDVGFIYPGGVEALHGVHFTIAGGEALGIVGPSGAGKSTVVQLLLRLREPTTGSLTVNGKPLAQIDLDDWYRRIALVPQDSRVLQASIVDNVAFFRPEVSEEMVAEALRQAHALEEFQRLPDGLHTKIGGEWGHRISGGQRQRLSIARALVGQPEILVMDEPTSSLDLVSEEIIRETLQELKGQVTLVIIAHRLSTLRVCDRVVVMKAGTIEAIGDRTQLSDGNAFFAEAVRLAHLV